MISESIIKKKTKHEYMPEIYFRLTSFALVMCSVLLPSRLVFADDAVQFNTDVLDVKDRSKIDLGQFSRSGYLMPGSYQLAIRVNSSELPEQKIDFIPPENDPKGSQACLTPEIVKDLGLKDSVYRNLSWTHNGQCLSLDALEGMTIRPDLGQNSLYISLPQAFVEYTSENWEPPSRWDNGIAGMLFDYNMNAMTTHQESGGRNDSVSGNGTSGVNMGAWRLRGDWQSQYNKNSTGGSQSNFDWVRYYAYRAITSLRAKLTLGENYLDSSMFDSFRYTGGSLSTDDNQLPLNLRGYAPEVSGVAKTNAKVTVSQQGRVLYETTVASGPFRIQDLNSAVSGKLNVKVEEQDGTVQTFDVDTANIPYLTRPGLVRYKFAMGKPSDYEHHSQGQNFATGEISWGVNNGWSLYGGGIFSAAYNALAIGIGRDLLAFGALSFDVTESSAEMQDGDMKRGGSYRLSYSKRFDEYDSQVTFAGYRFAEREFMSMSQFLQARYEGNVSAGNDKEMYTVTLNKQFSDINLSLYLNYSHQTYWDRDATDTWNLSASQYFDMGPVKNASLSVSAYQTQYDNSKDDGVYVSLSLPTGDSGTVSYNGQFSNGENSNTVGYYDRIDANNTYRVNAGTTSDGRGTGDGYFTHEGELASLTTNASFTGSEYNAFGMSLQGGLTATANGAALHRTSSAGGTRMLVDTGGVSDVPVNGNGGIVTSNYFGKAVVGDVSSYYRNSVSVALDKLPDDIEATRSVVQGTLTEGAIGYRKFGILSGEKAMVTIRLHDGSSPPFGAELSNQDGAQTGIVNDGGSVWLSGMRPGEIMDVKWGGAVKCRVTLPSNVIKRDSMMLLPCSLVSAN